MKRRTTLFYLCASALCTALIAVCSFISIPVGYLKITLQLLAVLLSAGLLPPVWSVGTVAAYILLGVVGVPVFAGFSSGVGTLAGPTGGYIVGFLPAALCASLLLRFTGKRSFLKTLGAFAASTLLCYLCGVVGFCIYMPEKGVLYALTATLLPYVGFDAVKIAAAAFLTQKLYPRVSSFAQGAD